MSDPERYLCVYCGSRTGDDPAFARAARAVGASLARRGVGLVYGGGNIGLMGLTANACLSAGGTVVGVIPRGLFEIERMHENVSELVVTDGMHARKMVMADRADAFLALPGGFGTMDETFEVLTWRHIGIHEKPIGLLDVNGYYQPFVALERHMRARGFIAPGAYEPMVDDDVERILAALLDSAS